MQVRRIIGRPGGADRAHQVAGEGTGARGIRANAIAPGYIDRATDALPEAARTAILESTPLKRLGDPADVARAVRFLASDAASFITGDVLAVDGGLGA